MSMSMSMIDGAREQEEKGIVSWLWMCGGRERKRKGCSVVGVFVSCRGCVGVNVE